MGPLSSRPGPPKGGAAGVGHPPAAFTIKLEGGKHTEGTYWLKEQPESAKIASHIGHTRTEHSWAADMKTWGLI